MIIHVTLSSAWRLNQTYMGGSGNQIKLQHEACIYKFVNFSLRCPMIASRGKQTMQDGKLKK